MEEILLNIESKEIRCAHLRNGTLRNLIVERNKDRQITGNIYKGKVKRILDNIQSAFVDINEGDNGFIHITDIRKNTEKLQEQFDMDFELTTPSEKKESGDDADIEELMKIDQPVLVQVVKEAMGNKGARLTCNLSIAGRYLVLLPNSGHRGVSRKIEDRSARDRLKRVIRAFEMPGDMGLICRTASCYATTDMLIDEANELLNTWLMIVKKFEETNDPCLLYAESDLIRRSILTAVDKRYDRILIDDYQTYQACKQFYRKYEKEHPIKIDLYRDNIPIFERFNVEKEIERSLRRKIWLPSGGYLFFDRTEAMYTVDVNSGGSSNGSDSNVEEALVRINLEAAEEIANQLRIRNIGGLIICDFIDMRFRKNQRRVLEKLKECMKEDHAKCTILGMSEFGLIEMTRQRNRGSLAQLIFTHCPYCSGGGLIKTHESISIEIERQLKKVILHNQQYGIKLLVHPELKRYLDRDDRDYLLELAEKQNAHLEIETDDNLHLNDFHFLSSITGKPIEGK